MIVRNYIPSRTIILFQIFWPFLATIFCSMLREHRENFCQKSISLGPRRGSKGLGAGALSRIWELISPGLRRSRGIPTGSRTGRDGFFQKSLYNPCYPVGRDGTGRVFQRELQQPCLSHSSKILRLQPKRGSEKWIDVRTDGRTNRPTNELEDRWTNLLTNLLLQNEFLIL